jgi:hypothetical protein
LDMFCSHQLGAERGIIRQKMWLPLSHERMETYHFRGYGRL